jgi:ADP-heptose:LPS heptosyltransferase
LICTKIVAVALALFNQTGSKISLHLLFITRRHIGDALMTTPVLEAMHQRYPSARIDILAGPQSAILFEYCPYRGQIWRMDKGAGYQERLGLIRQLRRQHYDLIVDLRTDGLAYFLRAREKRTRWGARDRIQRCHDVERHAAIFDRTLSLQALPSPVVWLDPKTTDQAQRRLRVLPGRRWLALAPGANWGPKCWPVARFVELIAAIGEEFDGVLLLGGPDDIPRSRELAELIQYPCLNLTGDTDLLLAAGLLAKASAFVGNDSGLGHLASAVGTPSLTVFGPGEPERFHPWGCQADWMVATDRDLSKLTGQSVAERLRTHLSRLESPAD